MSGWFIFGCVQIFTWSAILDVVGRLSGRRYWMILLAGIALNLSGFAEGIARQKLRDASSFVLTSVEMPR